MFFHTYSFKLAKVGKQTRAEFRGRKGLRQAYEITGGADVRAVIKSAALWTFYSQDSYFNNGKDYKWEITRQNGDIVYEFGSYDSGKSVQYNIRHNLQCWIDRHIRSMRLDRFGEWVAKKKTPKILRFDPVKNNIEYKPAGNTEFGDLYNILIDGWMVGKLEKSANACIFVGNWERDDGHVKTTPAFRFKPADFERGLAAMKFRLNDGFGCYEAENTPGVLAREILQDSHIGLESTWGEPQKYLRGDIQDMLTREWD